MTVTQLEGVSCHLNFVLPPARHRAFHIQQKYSVHPAKLQNSVYLQDMTLKLKSMGFDLKIEFLGQTFSFPNN